MEGEEWNGKGEKERKVTDRKGLLNSGGWKRRGKGRVSEGNEEKGRRWTPREVEGRK